MIFGCCLVTLASHVSLPISPNFHVFIAFYLLLSGNQAAFFLFSPDGKTIFLFNPDKVTPWNLDLIDLLNHYALSVHSG